MKQPASHLLNFFMLDMSETEHLRGAVRGANQWTSVSLKQYDESSRKNEDSSSDVDRDRGDETPEKIIWQKPRAGILK